MLKILFLFLSWFAASAYGKTPKEWIYHFQQGTFADKIMQTIVTAILSVLLAHSLTEFYRYTDEYMYEKNAAESNTITPQAETVSSSLQQDIDNEQQQFAKQETILNTLLNSFKPNTLKYYVSKDHTQWQASVQQNCQDIAQQKTDLYAQQLSRFQCLNQQYQQYIADLSSNQSKIEQFSSEYQSLLKKYENHHSQSSSQQEQHNIHDALKKDRTKCEHAYSHLIQVLECKIGSTQQALNALILAEKPSTPTQTTTPMRTPTPTPKTALDNLF